MTGGRHGKAVNLDSRSPSPIIVDENPKAVVEEDDDDDSCLICLQGIVDRTILICGHDRFCFECILIWTGTSVPNLFSSPDAEKF